MLVLATQKPQVGGIAQCNAPMQCPNENHGAPNTSPNMSRRNKVRVGYVRVGFALGTLISSCLSHFCLYLVSNANAVSGGIWAVIGPLIHLVYFLYTILIISSTETVRTLYDL